MSYETVFADVVKRAGSLTSLAHTLGKPIPTVSSWRKRGVPPLYCKAVETLTGVSVKRLRPDDWHDYWPELGRRRKAAAQ